MLLCLMGIENHNRYTTLQKEEHVCFFGVLKQLVDYGRGLTFSNTWWRAHHLQMGSVPNSESFLGVPITRGSDMYREPKKGADFPLHGSPVVPFTLCLVLGSL